MADADPCANCGAPMGGAAFCGGCGQRRARPLEVGRLLAEGAAQFVSFDNAWWATLRELSLRPGAMVRRYVAGERIRFVNPILYMLTMATALLIAMHTLGVDIGAVQAVEEAQRANFALILSAVGYLAVLGALPVAAALRLALRHETVGSLYVLLLYAYGHLALFQTLLYALGAASDPGAFIASRIASGAFFAWVFAGYFGWRPVRALVGGMAAYVLMLLSLMACGAGLVAAKTLIEGLTG